MKLKHLLLGLGALAALFSCKQEEPYVEPSLVVTPNVVNFTSLAEEKVVYITSNNDWTAESDQQWLDLSATSGKASEEKVELVLSAAENTAELARVAKVTVKAAGLTKEITVTQAAVDAKPEEPAQVTVSVEAIEAAVQAGEYTFTLTANKAWTVTSDSEWAVVAPASGEPTTEAVTVKVTVAENTAEESRTATIKVVAQDAEKTITVTQAPVVIVEDGTEANPWLIKSAADFKAMRDKATAGAETYFKMVNDVDMAGVTDYVPVNWDGDFSRKVNFDGGNFTLSNFVCKSANYGEGVGAYPSVFGVLYGSCQNLKVVNATVESSSAAGIIGGYVGTTDKPATVTNVSVQGTITGTTDRIGGFAGCSVASTFTDCKADVTVSSTSSDVAGFVGKAQQTISFVRCEAKVNLSSSKSDKNRVGGFVGWLSTTTANFENCKVLSGSIIEDKSAKSGSTIGFYSGFVAYAGSTESTTIKNCSVDATVNAVNCQSVSGFVAVVSGAGSLTLEGCQFNGSLVGTNQIAGLLAYSENAKDILVKDSNSTATITGGTATNSHYCCGLLGNIAVAETVTLKNSYAAGEIVSGGSSNAGLIGAQVKGTATVEDCYATCSISGNTNNGGLLGNMGVPATVKNSYFKGAYIKSNSGSTGGIVGNSNVTLMENCYAETNISGKTASIGGLIGAQSRDITITNCHFSGTVESVETNVGGLIGRCTAGIATVSKCYTTGAVNITADKNNSGGFFGYATGFVLTDSWTSMDVTSGGQSVGGIAGTAGAPCVIRNCFATGNVSGRCAGGIVGQSYNNADGSAYENNVFWGNVTNNKNQPTQYSGGAIIGCVHTKLVTAKNCWRGANVQFTDYSGVYEGEIMYNNPLVDHEDVINDLPPYVSGIPSTASNAYAQRPYHGKAAAANATISSVAKTLGWDEAIWDLSKDVPTLK